MSKENEDYPYNLEILRKKVKNITLSVRPGRKVRITAPQDYDVSPYLKSKEKWIFRQINKFEKLCPEMEDKEGLMLYNGIFYPIKEEKNRCGIFPDENTAYYNSVKNFKEWLKSDLRNDLTLRLKEHSIIMDASFKGFSIRTQKTRWGSCSTSGKLNFNIRMAAIPDNLKDYIVIHELAHIYQPNHSPDFWKIVTEYDSNFKSHREELKKYWIMTETSKVWNTITEK